MHWTIKGMLLSAACLLFMLGMGAATKPLAPGLAALVVVAACAWAVEQPLAKSAPQFGPTESTLARAEQTLQRYPSLLTLALGVVAIAVSIVALVA